MSLRFHWFLPTNGDGRDIVGGGHGVATGAAGAIRPPSIQYLGQIALPVTRPSSPLVSTAPPVGFVDVAAIFRSSGPSDCGHHVYKGAQTLQGQPS